MLEIKNITKEYGNKEVVKDISFNVEKGKVFGFLGQNGSGKTTTMKMIVGLIKPTKGNILIDGDSPLIDETRHKIGFMPEAPYFYERLTGAEFLKFCHDLYGSGVVNNLDREEVLSMVGIYEAKDQPIRSYSKGMRQRLGFAQAIVNDPEYIFFDEPLDGLDPVGRKEIKKIINNLKNKKRTIFFNSHILYDVEELCDEIGIIHEGDILYKGSVNEFTQGDNLEDKFVNLISDYKKY